MPFGSRRFTQLVYGEETINGQRCGQYRARFVPLDFGASDELLTEEQLAREVADNAMSLRPVPDKEEQLAMLAFRQQSRNKAYSRAAVASVEARGQQRVLVDVLDVPERAIIERWRNILARAKLPPRAESQDGPDPSASSKRDFLDASRDALAIVDKYLSKGRS